MSARPCRACGMPIEFLSGPNGKQIPAQRVRTVYVVSGGPNELERAQLVGGIDSMFVSHFETCPKASEFSKKKAPATARGPPKSPEGRC